MPYTESQINALYASIGWEQLYPLAGNATEVLGAVSGDTPVVGAQVAWTATGLTGARASNTNRANFTGTATSSYIDLLTLNGIGNRINTGGGIAFGICFKLPNTTTLWRLGEVKGASNEFYFGSVFNTTRLDVSMKAGGTSASAQSTGYIFNSTLGNGFNDGFWHHLLFQYSEDTGATEWWLDGFLHSRAYATGLKGAAKYNFAHFMLGASANSSGVATNYAPMALAGFCCAPRTFSARDIYTTSRLEFVKYTPAGNKSYHIGVNSPSISAGLVDAIQSGSPRILQIGDSTLSSSGIYTQTEMVRQIAAISGGRLANVQITPGDDTNDGDANTLYGCYKTIAAGATQRILFQLWQEGSEQSRYVLGGDDYWRVPNVLDLSQGFDINLHVRKGSYTSGTLDVSVEAGGAQFSTGAEAWVGTVATATPLPYTSLIGTASAKNVKITASVPTGGRHNWYAIKIVNNTNATVTYHLPDLVSVANRAGVYYYEVGRGGRRWSTPGYSDLTGAQGLVESLGITHLVGDLGTNDSAGVEPENVAATVAAVHDQYAAVLPALATIWAIPAQRANTWDGTNSNTGHLANIRLEQYAAAMEEYLAANPSKKIKVVNATRLWIEQGVNELSISFLNKNVIGAWSSATTYQQGQYAYVDGVMPGNNRVYYYCRTFNNTNNSPLTSTTWTPIGYTTSDGVHLSWIGQTMRAQRLASAMLSGKVNAFGEVWHPDVWAGANR